MPIRKTPVALEYKNLLGEYHNDRLEKQYLVRSLRVLEPLTKAKICIRIVVTETVAANNPGN